MRLISNMNCAADEKGDIMQNQSRVNDARQKLREAVRNAFRIMIDPEQLGSVLKSLGLSNRALSRMSGVNHTTVNEVVNGEVSPTAATLDRLGKALVEEMAERCQGELTQDEFTTYVSRRTSEKMRQHLRLKLHTSPAKEEFVRQCQQHAKARLMSNEGHRSGHSDRGRLQ
jgi:transcriptional regulator with XRE-family HTH domain